MDMLSYEDKVKLIGKMTESDISEVLQEAQFHRVSTEDWLNSPWAADLRRRVMERD